MRDIIDTSDDDKIKISKFGFYDSWDDYLIIPNFYYNIFITEDLIKICEQKRE